MGVQARLIDYDKEFDQLSSIPTIVNDFNTSIPEEKDRLAQYIYTHYQNTDTIEAAATCHCGKRTEARYIGRVCDYCHTEIVSTTNHVIESNLWIRAPEGVDALFHPQVWLVLDPVLKMKDFNFLEYLCNTNYRPDINKITSKEPRRKVEKFLAFNPKRGWNNFIRHFDEYMDFMLSNNIVDPAKANKNELRQFIKENRQCFFPTHLPIPSRLCFVVETTNSGVYIDKPLGQAMDAVHTIAGIRSTQYPIDINTIQNRVFKANSAMKDFYAEYTGERLAKKPGLFRRHVFGSRLHFSARGVITSISDPHRYDEIHIPWGMGLQLLKYHILNKLHRRGYTTRSGLDLIYTHVLQYNELLDQIMQELIAESPDGLGLVCVLQRNPTLQRGSTQQLYITRVKTNVNVNTISLSALILRAPNKGYF